MSLQLRELGYRNKTSKDKSYLTTKMNVRGLSWIKPLTNVLLPFWWAQKRQARVLFYPDSYTGFIGWSHHLFSYNLNMLQIIFFVKLHEIEFFLFSWTSLFSSLF